MDLLYFLRERLTFIRNLYDSATLPFEETIRKIENGEPPYIETWGYEDAGEPQFLAEFQEADNAVTVIGRWCLCMVQASLHAYLSESITPAGSVWWDSEALQKALPLKKGGSWFGRYELLFREELGIDFNDGPVKLSDLEQLNLTRNDLLHNFDLFSERITRSKDHAQRFPVALFTEELWVGLGVEEIKVTSDKLILAIELVRSFCKWLDGIRCKYPVWLRAQKRDANQ